MIVTSQFSKTKKPLTGSKLAKRSPSALGEAARRRRHVVLKAVKPDAFFSSVPARKRAQRRERVRRPSPTCTCDVKREPGAIPHSSICAPVEEQDTRPVVINVGGGMVANARIAAQMPAQLQRPCLQETLPEAMAQAGYDSALALKGLEIVRRELIRNGECLYTAVTNTVCDPIVATHSRELPELINIRVPKTVSPGYMPSHILMVHSGKPDIKLRKMLAVPIHAPVLAAHCSRVPALPNPRPLSPSLDPIDVDSCANKRIVPLVPFAIPSPETFPLMMRFLCTQDLVHLFRALVPIPPLEGGPSQLSKHLAETFTGASLISGAMRVYGVWQNACSLGVLNPRIWQVIDVAWKGYRDALLLKQR